MVLPTLTPEQRSAALRKAATARLRRAEVKHDLKTGQMKLSEFFQVADREEALAKMKVKALLVSLPRVGATTAEAILLEVRIAESRRVRGLGANQREELISRFG